MNRRSKLRTSTEKIIPLRLLTLIGYSAMPSVHIDSCSFPLVHISKQLEVPFRELTKIHNKGQIDSHFCATLTELREDFSQQACHSGTARLVPLFADKTTTSPIVCLSVAIGTERDRICYCVFTTIRLARASTSLITYGLRRNMVVFTNTFSGYLET